MGSLAASVDDNYFEALGLAFDALADNAMPDFFFVGGQRRFLVQRAVHRLYFSGGTALVLGANGAGKTRMLDEIAAELRDIADICRIEATVLMDGAQIRVLLADAMRLPAESAFSAPDLMLALTHSRPEGEEPLPVVLMIDCAHSLSIEALVETAVLVQSAGGRLRLLLAGEDDLAASWGRANVGAAEILQLPALDRQETADYLHTRLQAAGATCPMPFEGALLDELYAQAGGNIGVIHALAPRLLVPAQLERASLPARIRALPALHIVAIAALLAVVILLILYRGAGTAPSAKGENSVAKSQVGGDRQSVSLALPTSPPAAVSPSSIPAVPAPQAETAAPPRNKEVVGMPEPHRVAEPEPVKRSELPKAAEPAKRMPAKTTIVSAVKRAPARVAPAALPSLTADERELLAQPSQQFVVQLLGAASLRTAEKFKTGAGSGQRLWICRTQLHGKPWFVVLTGPYHSKIDAQAAIVKMPESLRKQQPWARALGGVQADIRAYASRR